MKFWRLFCFFDVHLYTHYIISFCSDSFDLCDGLCLWIWSKLHVFSTFGPTAAPLRARHARGPATSGTPCTCDPTMQQLDLQCCRLGAGWIVASGLRLSFRLSMDEATWSPKPAVTAASNAASCDCCNSASDRSADSGNFFADLLFFALHSNATDHSFVGCTEISAVSWTLGSSLCSRRSGKDPLCDASCCTSELLGEKACVGAFIHLFWLLNDCFGSQWYHPRLARCQAVGWSSSLSAEFRHAALSHWHLKLRKQEPSDGACTDGWKALLDDWAADWRKADSSFWCHGGHDTTGSDYVACLHGETLIRGRCHWDPPM